MLVCSELFLDKNFFDEDRAVTLRFNVVWQTSTRERHDKSYQKSLCRAPHARQR